VNQQLTDWPINQITYAAPHAACKSGLCMYA